MLNRLGLGVLGFGLVLGGCQAGAPDAVDLPAPSGAAFAHGGPTPDPWVAAPAGPVVFETPAPHGVIVREIVLDEFTPPGVGLAFDDVDGRFFMLGVAGDVFLELDENGVFVANHPYPFPGTYSAIGVVPGAHEVLVTDTQTYMGYRIDADTDAVVGTFCLKPSAPVLVNTAIAYDASTDHILVAPYTDTGFGGPTEPRLEVYDRATGVLVYERALDAAAELLDVDPASGEIRIVSNGELILLGAPGAADVVERLLYLELAPRYPWSWARDAATGHHWVADAFTRTLAEVR